MYMQVLNITVRYVSEPGGCEAIFQVKTDAPVSSDATVSAKSTLGSLVQYILGVTTDQLFLEEWFFIDFKFDSDHLLFLGINQIIHIYLSNIYLNCKMEALYLQFNLLLSL